MQRHLWRPDWKEDKVSIIVNLVLMELLIVLMDLLLRLVFLNNMVLMVMVSLDISLAVN